MTYFSLLGTGFFLNLALETLFLVFLGSDFAFFSSFGGGSSLEASIQN